MLNIPKEIGTTPEEVANAHLRAMKEQDRATFMATLDTHTRDNIVVKTIGRPITPERYVSNLLMTINNKNPNLRSATVEVGKIDGDEAPLKIKNLNLKYPWNKWSDAKLVRTLSGDWRISIPNI